MSDIKKYKSPFHATHPKKSADVICEMFDQIQEQKKEIDKLRTALLSIENMDNIFEIREFVEELEQPND